MPESARDSVSHSGGSASASISSARADSGAFDSFWRISTTNRRSMSSADPDATPAINSTARATPGQSSSSAASSACACRISNTLRERPYSVSRRARSPSSWESSSRIASSSMDRTHAATSSGGAAAAFPTRSARICTECSSFRYSSETN